MVSHLFFYQLGLIALVWLCVMLHWAWPSDPAAVCPTTPEPPGPRPKRKREPTPFAGLTQKPPCDACEHRGDPHPQPPASPPPRIVPTRGPRRQVDTSRHCCPNPVLQWLVEAADQLQAFSRHVLHDVRVRQVQLDELFALLSAVKDGEGSKAEALERLERSPRWVWVAMDPESKLLLAIDVGNRTLAMAQRLVHHVAQVLAPDCAPLFLTDGFKEYLTALLTHYGHWV